MRQNMQHEQMQAPERLNFLFEAGWPKQKAKLSPKTWISCREQSSRPKAGSTGEPKRRESLKLLGSLENKGLETLGTAQRLRPAWPQEKARAAKGGRKLSVAAEVEGIVHQLLPPHQLPQPPFQEPSPQPPSEAWGSAWVEGCSAWAEAEAEVDGSATATGAKLAPAGTRMPQGQSLLLRQRVVCVGSCGTSVLCAKTKNVAGIF